MPGKIWNYLLKNKGCLDFKNPVWCKEEETERKKPLHKLKIQKCGLPLLSEMKLIWKAVTHKKSLWIHLCCMSYSRSPTGFHGWFLFEGSPTHHHTFDFPPKVHIIVREGFFSKKERKKEMLSTWSILYFYFCVCVCLFFLRFVCLLGH